MTKLKTARGRGNQSDWAAGNRGTLTVRPALHVEQQKHNEEVERKKAAKRKRRAERAAT